MAYTGPTKSVTLDNIRKAIRALRIPEFFPDYEEPLFVAALTPLGRIHFGLLMYLKHHFINDNGNYETMEYYGDLVLYTYVLETQRQYYGRHSRPDLRKSMHDGKVQATSNQNLRKLSHKYGVCTDVYGIKEADKIKPHNPCADLMEALPGAMYLQYGPEGLPTIFQWLDTVYPELKAGLTLGDPDDVYTSWTGSSGASSVC